MKPRHLLICGALLLAASAQAATPGVDAPPPPAAPRPVTLPPLHEAQLPNGLSVVVAPRHALPLVSATLLVRVGAEADPVGRAGLAELANGLLNKGATRKGKPVGATALARQAEALGGTLDGGSGWHASSMGMTVATPQLAPALALVADVVRRPLLADDELERLREQSLDGLRVAFESPGELAAMAARRSFWGPGAYGAIVTPKSLQTIAPADVQAFHRRHYRPDQALLVLAGDVTPEQGLRLARQYFGDWKRPTAEPPPAGAGGPPSALASATLLVNLPSAGQSGVVLTAPFVSLAPADRPELRIAQVANALLGGGYSARLNQEVRIKRGLSYGAGSGAELHAEGGMLSASAQTNHPTAGRVLQLMRDEIARIGREEAPADELAARQASLVGDFARRLETNAGVAALVVSQWSRQRPLADLNDYVPEVLAVTPAQVREFAARRWTPQSLRAVVVGDLKAAGDTLPKGDGVLRVDAPALRFDR